MALIKCPECGREISDKANFCPGCGCPASEFKQNNVPEDTRSELDRIADEIAEWCPSKVRSVKVFQEKTGVDLKTAKQYMDLRYDGKGIHEVSEEVCPKCGSKNVTFEKEPDRSTTVSYFKGVYNTTYRPGKTKAKCGDCGKKWKF